MKLIAVSVGLPRTVHDERRGPVPTGIWKQPVTGTVAVTRENLAGDGQADLVNHGGEFKAVYAYPGEHYPFWAETLGREDLAPGAFGENLTTAGLTEENVCIGDRLRIGSAVLEVSQPRTPCFKLALRFGDPKLPRRFLASGRSGFYLRVVQPGELAAGAAIEPLARGEGGMSVAEVNRLMHNAPRDLDGAARAVVVPALAPGWREEFAARLQSGRAAGELR